MLTLHRIPLRIRGGSPDCRPAPLRHRIVAHALSSRACPRGRVLRDRCTGPVARSLVEYFLATTAVFGLLCALFL